MEMTSGVMTPTAHLVAQWTHRLRVVCATSSTSCALALNPQTCHKPYNFSPGDWNLNLSRVRISRRPVDVAPCRDEDRYGITPETDAEAEAAMQRTNSNNVNTSTQQVQVVVGAQGSQGHRSAQGQSSDFEGEPLIGCCGFYLVRRRPASN
ncbi:hypothetical protein BDR07DRAFT_730238 [Suillus spraguei]|nr:hypothetical protein BDR07DRAFT_730238 [Suillus spraguei]